MLNSQLFAALVLGYVVAPHAQAHDLHVHKTDGNAGLFRWPVAPKEQGS